MKLFKTISVIGMCLLAAGCYYDSQEALYGTASNVPCDTTNVTYSGKVAPIINAYCSSCHSKLTSSSGNGIVLDNLQGLQDQVAKGKLMGDIKQSPGFNAMPLNGSRLDPCSIVIIQKWVDKGTPSN